MLFRCVNSTLCSQSCILENGSSCWERWAEHTCHGWEGLRSFQLPRPSSWVNWKSHPLDKLLQVFLMDGHFEIDTRMNLFNCWGEVRKVKFQRPNNTNANRIRCSLSVLTLKLYPPLSKFYFWPAFKTWKQPTVTHTATNPDRGWVVTVAAGCRPPLLWYRHLHSKSSTETSASSHFRFPDTKRAFLLLINKIFDKIYMETVFRHWKGNL